jgi:hypothetical protein
LSATEIDMTNDEAQDHMIDNATHAAAAEFEECGIKLTVDEMYRINDLLTEILGNRIPAIPPAQQ